MINLFQKRRHCYLLLFMAFVLVDVGVKAQPKEFSKKEKEKFWKAENLFEYKDYYGSSVILAELYDKYPDYNTLNYKLGVSYYQLEENKKAKELFNKTKGEISDSYYYLAKISLEDEDTEKALEYLNELSRSGIQSANLFGLKEIEKLRNEIEYAKKAMSNPENVTIENLGPNVNTSYSEYVPVITIDEKTMYFTSRRMHDNNRLDPTGQPFEDIYVTEKTNEGWSKAKLLPGEVNTELHDACVGLSSNGDIMFIFKTSENYYGNLYQSDRKNGLWSKPVKMGHNINSENSNETSASISMDGNTIYFSSDRPGGYGGFDIYRVVKLPNGLWSEAKNLGPVINTEYNEEAPFIHPDGYTLYFSSEGHENMGGYDIFSSKKTGSIWSKPKNLGYPTNTTRDDIFFVITPDEKHGYYSTEKEDGYGQQDIYMINYLERDLRSSVVKGLARDSKTGKPVSVVASLMEMDSGNLIGLYKSRQRDGNFIMLFDPNVDYILLVEAEGYENVIQEYSFSVSDLLKSQLIEVELNPTK